MTEGAGVAAADDGGSFHDTLARLLGMHCMSQNFAAGVLRVSPTTMSLWLRGRTAPSLESVLVVARFFEISVDALLSTPFAQLLDGEAGSRDRFERVERKLKRGELPVPGMTT